MDRKKQPENCQSRHSNFSTTWTYTIVFLCKWEVEEHCNALIQTPVVGAKHQQPGRTTGAPLSISSPSQGLLHLHLLTCQHSHEFAFLVSFYNVLTLPKNPTVLSVHRQLCDPNPTVSLDILIAVILSRYQNKAQLQINLPRQPNEITTSDFELPAVSLCICRCFQTQETGARFHQCYQQEFLRQIDLITSYKYSKKLNTVLSLCFSRASKKYCFQSMLTYVHTMTTAVPE